MRPLQSHSQSQGSERRSLLCEPCGLAGIWPISIFRALGVSELPDPTNGELHHPTKCLRKVYRGIRDSGCAGARTGLRHAPPSPIGDYAEWGKQGLELKASAEISEDAAAAEMG